MKCTGGRNSEDDCLLKSCKITSGARRFFAAYVSGSFSFFSRGCLHVQELLHEIVEFVPVHDVTGDELGANPWIAHIGLRMQPEAGVEDFHEDAHFLLAAQPVRTELVLCPRGGSCWEIVVVLGHGVHAQVGCWFQTPMHCCCGNLIQTQLGEKLQGVCS